MEDTYLRLDLEIAAFLKTLDTRIGNGNYILFLTADHGAVNNPEFNQDSRIPAGNIQDNSISDSLKLYLNTLYKDTNLVLSASSHNIYLNREQIEKENSTLKKFNKSARILCCILMVFLRI